MSRYPERHRQASNGRSSPLGALVLSGLCVAVGLLTALSNSAIADEQKCSTSSKDTICGVTNVEDLVAIDGTPWAIGSSLAGGSGKAEPLYLFDTKTFTASAIPGSGFAIHPDKTTYPNCPAAPDFSKFASHGLDFRGAVGNGDLS